MIIKFLLSLLKILKVFSVMDIGLRKCRFLGVCFVDRCIDLVVGLFSLNFMKFSCLFIGLVLIMFF